MRDARPDGQSALLFGGYEAYARVSEEESATELEKTSWMLHHEHAQADNSLLMVRFLA
jgi:hypothetical protein